MQSHPTWVRGLKHVVATKANHYSVAPYVGAWIETTPTTRQSSRTTVAPYVGAWIETRQISTN